MILNSNLQGMGPNALRLTPAALLGEAWDAAGGAARPEWPASIRGW